MTTADRNTQRAYERATDVYGRHIDTCPRCSTYAGPPLQACAGGEKLLRRMAAFWGKGGEHAEDRR